MFKIILILILISISSEVQAYIGPGLGGGVIAATLGIIFAILAAIFGLLWFPIKRLLKERKKKKMEQNNRID
tara:strand:+ start:2054 stop:2269 length:216 start_codon:yes stop_codon:yes gene_type:complete